MCFFLFFVLIAAKKGSGGALLVGQSLLMAELRRVRRVMSLLLMEHPAQHIGRVVFCLKFEQFCHILKIPRLQF